jgi:hypothetical protein
MKNLLVLSFAILSLNAFAQNASAKLPEGLYAKFSTTKGEIICQLYFEKVPMTVGNFIGLAEGKLNVDTVKIVKPFFNGLKFHRVIREFMIQGGDPAGNGSGGPGYKFYDEIDTTLKHLYPGILSMANSGPNTNGSQFFITHKATPWLDGKHTVFGRVVVGQEIVNAIEQNDVMNQVTILRIGKKAQAFVGQKGFDSKYLPMKKIEEQKQEGYKKIAAMTDAEYFQDFKNRVSKVETRPNLMQAASGLMFVIEKAGDTLTPKMGSKISLHYRGTLFATGEKFDASYDRNMPLDFNFQVQRMIPGFEEGIKLLGKGGKAKLYIPYRLAYGPAGRPGIPPYSDLIFEIEMMNCEAPMNAPLSPDGHEHHEGDGHNH